MNSVRLFSPLRLGSRAIGCAALVTTEASAVSPKDGSHPSIPGSGQEITGSPHGEGFAQLEFPPGQLASLVTPGAGSSRKSETTRERG